MHHLTHDLATLHRHAAGAGSELVGLAGVVGVLAGGGTQLLHGSRGFFQGRGLLLGATGQVRVALGDFRAGRGHAVCAVPHFGHHLGQGRLHVVQGVDQRRELIPAVVLRDAGQVAVAHPFGHRLRHRHAPAQQARHVPGKRQQAHRDHQRQDGDQVRGREHLFFDEDDVLGQALRLDLPPAIELGQQQIARGNRHVHQVGESFFLLAFADQGNVGFAIFPERGHQGREFREVLLALLRKQALFEGRQGFVHAGALGADVVQRFLQLLRGARQDGVPDLQRHLGHVELQLGHGFQLGHPAFPGVVRQHGRVVQTDVGESGKCCERQRNGDADGIQPLRNPKRKSGVHVVVLSGRGARLFPTHPSAPRRAGWLDGFPFPPGRT